MRWPKLQFKVRRLMVAVALFSVLFLLGAPLVRLGRPPCLSISKTASWLIARPGRANCADCHATARVKWPQSLSSARPEIDAVRLVIE
jgi:hypothetical protein